MACGHITSEGRLDLGHCQCPVAKPWSLESKGKCRPCVTGKSRPVAHDLLEQAMTDFRNQMTQLEAEQRAARQRWFKYQERCEEELYLCRLLPEMLTFVQAERLLDLYNLLTSDQTEFFGTGKGRQRLYLLERSIAKIPRILLQGMHIGSLALQAFVTSTTLVTDSNQYLHDIFMFEPPEEINLPDMESGILVWEQLLVGQIRHLKERLAGDPVLELALKDLLSNITGRYFSWRDEWELHGPGIKTDRQLESHASLFVVLMPIENLPLDEQQCPICREDYGACDKGKKPEMPARILADIILVSIVSVFG